MAATQDAVINFELYKKGDMSSGITKEQPFTAGNVNSQSSAFYLEVGDYCLKYVTDDETQGDKIKIKEDNHTTVDAYGHCEHCGAYQGETESINSYFTVTFEGNETLYYRFKINSDLKHRIVFASGEFNYTAYGVSFAGNDYDADVDKYNTAKGIELDGTLRDFEASDYIYLVITKKGTTSSVTVQLEESSF